MNDLLEEVVPKPPYPRECGTVQYSIVQYSTRAKLFCIPVDDHQSRAPFLPPPKKEKKRKATPYGMGLRNLIARYSCSSICVHSLPV